MVRVNVGEYIKKNGASFYAQMLQDEKKQVEHAKKVRATVAAKRKNS